MAGPAGNPLVCQPIRAALGVSEEPRALRDTEQEVASTSTLRDFRRLKGGKDKGERTNPVRDKAVNKGQAKQACMQEY